MELWVIKLGGSIITEKQAGVPDIRKQLVSQICEKIANFLVSHQDIQILLLHGAGSIGHPLAKQYGLSGGVINSERILGVGKTIAAMRGLSDYVASIFQGYSIPAISMQTSSMFYRDEHNQLVFSSKEILQHMLDAKSIPILSGDVVLTSNATSSIASADELAVVCAQAFHATRILFASDIDGVYETFPPTSSETHLKNITRDDIQRFIDEAEMPHHSQDVTGGMKGKLSALLPLKSVEVSIFNGMDPENLALALQRKQVGTRIEL